MAEKGLLGLKHYHVPPTDRVLAYTYWNANGAGVVILAREGFAEDWGAYIGATCAERHTEEEAIAHVAAHGSKLSKEMATRWFPHLPAGAYRP